jgi:hypothetical protein
MLNNRWHAKAFSLQLRFQYKAARAACVNVRNSLLAADQKCTYQLIAPIPHWGASRTKLGGQGFKAGSV